jgi:choline-phosphate cytidylyltransferase
MRKVITYGTFDLFHDGHRRLLERARALGDYLIVGVTTEQFDIQRGKMNVVDSVITRIDNVRASGLTDEIIIEEHEGQKVDDIQKLGVDVFVVGSDWRGKFDYLSEYCEVKYLERTKDVSSTELRAKRMGAVKLGIVGSGRIAGRTAEETCFVSGVNTVAVYNPHPESARMFAERFDLNPFSGQYRDFLDKVDAVYIASPHGTHFRYAREALRMGKHVLCEKPMVLSEREARELFKLAAQQNLILMEAIKTAYAPGFALLMAVARDGKIGKVRDVEAAFTKLIPDVPGTREYDVDVGGSFTELASYCLLPVVKLLGADFAELRFEFFTDHKGVDIYSKAHFSYGGAIASAKTGIGVKSEGQLLISGAKGYILVKSPWWLFKGFEVCYENPENNENFSAPFAGYGMRYEVADFVRNINEPNMRCYKLSQADSVAMARIMEKFLMEREKARERERERRKQKERERRGAIGPDTERGRNR